MNAKEWITQAWLKQGLGVHTGTAVPEIEIQGLLTQLAQLRSALQECRVYVVQANYNWNDASRVMARIDKVLAETEGGEK